MKINVVSKHKDRLGRSNPDIVDLLSKGETLMSISVAPHLEKYMMRNVPRYTSYPTAPHFSSIDPDTYAAWLSGLDPTEPISLYLHVPFCRKLCWYCGCNMKLASRPEPLKAYAQTLKREIELLADHLPGRFTVSHLHWGGGTPTALEPEDLADIMGLVRSLFDFTHGAEVAIESDPRTLTDEMVNMIGRLGFNRASFGVQEFDPLVQKSINRIQPPEMVASAVEKLRAVGVKSINFDLIYGLPHQTVEKLQDTIDLCLAMRPDRVALFGYAHVPWMAKKQRMIDEKALPGLNERREQAETAALKMKEGGYQAIGFDHFALPEDTLAVAARNGALHRNFQGFTADHASTLIGLGSTSIGKTPYGYVQNITETGAWARSVEAGIFPIARGHALDPDDQMRGEIIERLMCDGSVNLQQILEAFDVQTHWSELFDLDEFIDDGLLTLDDDSTITLTPNGEALVRPVCTAFDAYFANGAARHSAAV